MTEPQDRLAERLRDLRREFDSGFAEPLGRSAEAPEKFLAIRVAEASYALRYEEIAGVAVSFQATAVPGPLPELLGLTGVRGRVVPVYSFAALLGVQPSATAPRWLVLDQQEELALAFDRLDGNIQVARADLLDSIDPGSHCPLTIRLANESSLVISVPSVVRAVRARVASVRPPKES